MADTIKGTVLKSLTGYTSVNIISNAGVRRHMFLFRVALVSDDSA